MAQGKLHKWIGAEAGPWKCRDCKLQRRYKERKPRPKSPVQDRKVLVEEYRVPGEEWVESTGQVPRCADILGCA